MAQRHEIEAWLGGVEQWGDRLAEVTDAIEESGAEDEAAWVEIVAGFDGLSEADTAQVVSQARERGSERVDAALAAVASLHKPTMLARLDEAVRQAHAAGASKMALHQASGLSRPHIDKILSQG